MERPDTMFWSNLTSTIVAVSAGLVCMAIWGVTGAAIGLLLSSVLKAVAMWIYYRRPRISHPPKGSPRAKEARPFSSSRTTTWFGRMSKAS